MTIPQTWRKFSELFASRLVLQYFLPPSYAATFSPDTFSYTQHRGSPAFRADSSDPSDLFLNAYMSVQKAQKLEEDGKLKLALQKYRYAASLLSKSMINRRTGSR